MQQDYKSVKYLPLAIVAEHTIEDTDVSGAWKNKRKKS